MVRGLAPRPEYSIMPNRAVYATRCLCTVSTAHCGMLLLWSRSEGEVQRQVRPAEREILYQLASALVVVEVAVSECHTGPAGLVADAAQGLPCQARRAGTNVEAVGEMKAAAQHDPATQPDDPIEQVGAPVQPSRPLKGSATSWRGDRRREPHIRLRAQTEQAKARRRIQVSPAAMRQGISASQRPEAAVQGGLGARIQPGGDSGAAALEVHRADLARRFPEAEIDEVREDGEATVAGFRRDHRRSIQ